MQEPQSPALQDVLAKLSPEGRKKVEEHAVTAVGRRQGKKAVLVLPPEPPQTNKPPVETAASQAAQRRLRQKLATKETA